MNLQKIEINPQFAEAIEKMEEDRKHLFITGKAGTGKSTLLSYFCKNTKKEHAILAPTGIAALNVKGQTIHRFFNFYIDITPTKIINGEVKPKDTELYSNLKTLIIDEVSMLRADLLDCIAIFLKKYGPRPDKAFGGIQMIFIGDLYQLPPVVIEKEKEIFNNHYQSPYFFSSNALKRLDLEIVELEKIYRQKELEFIHLLNKVRDNSVESSDIELLNQRYIEETSENTSFKQKQSFKVWKIREFIFWIIRFFVFFDNSIKKFKQKENKPCINLTSTNSKADQINSEYLVKIEGKSYRSTAEISGEFDESSYPTSVELEYKVGAQIMTLNNDSKDRWVNGSIGVIEKRKKDEKGEVYLIVSFPNKNVSYAVKRYKWEISRYYFDGKKIESEVIGSFRQFPFRLAWAITIHKSQGKTFDNVIIDIGRGIFATGQMYVALSRCTSFEGIVLRTPIKRHYIRTDYKIFKFLTDYQYQKSEKELSIEDKIAVIEQAIQERESIEYRLSKSK